MKLLGQTMTSASALGILVGMVLDARLANALSLNIVGKKRSEVLGAQAFSRRDFNRLGRRAVDMTGSFGNGSTTLSDQSDTLYMCKITLGGTEFDTMIDTGSSDLWVVGPVPGSTNLNISATVGYAEGNAQGTINTASLDFDDYTVSDQAYIDVVPSSNNPPAQGLIGLGPASASVVKKLVGTSAGDPPLDRIFRQNVSTPNFLSVLLSRVSDETVGSSPPVGQLTVGSIIQGMESISSQPQLPALVDQYGVQHWQTLMDENGIIGPDGQQINTVTTIPKSSNSNQLHVVFDTGFTLPQVTQDVADAIYGRVPGAVWIPESSNPGYWRIPCNYELNVTFLFGGVHIPIAPLDLQMVDQTDSEGNPLSCMSTFQQISPSVADHSRFGAFDMILGMAFLRNAYLLINFGDFVDGSTSNTAAPYIQLLSTTTPSDAHADFVRTRLGGVDTTASQAPLVPPDQAQHSPPVSNPNTNYVKNKVNNAATDVKDFFAKSVWFIVLAAVIGALVLAGIAGCVFWLCRRRRSKVRKEEAFVPAMGSYRQLRESMPPQRPDSPVWDSSYGGDHSLPEPVTHGAGYDSQATYSEPNFHVSSGPSPYNRR